MSKSSTKKRKGGVSGREQRRRQLQKRAQWRRTHPQEAQWQDALTRAALGCGPTPRHWLDTLYAYRTRYEGDW